MSRVSQRYGFTLIELLVVIAIIGVLASTIAMFIGGLQRKAQMEKTRGLIHRVSTALESYKEKYLRYPPSTAPFADGARDLHFWLCARLPVATAFNAAGVPQRTEEIGPLLNNLNNSEVASSNASAVSGFTASNMQAAQGQASQIIDHWKQRLGYYCAVQGAQYGGTAHNTNANHTDWTDCTRSFDLWSAGPDGTPAVPASGPPTGAAGDGDDIANWQPTR